MTLPGGRADVIHQGRQNPSLSWLVCGVVGKRVGVDDEIYELGAAFQGWLSFGNNPSPIGCPILVSGVTKNTPSECTNFCHKLVTWAGIWCLPKGTIDLMRPRICKYIFCGMICAAQRARIPERTLAQLALIGSKADLHHRSSRLASSHIRLASALGNPTVISKVWQLGDSLVSARGRL